MLIVSFSFQCQIKGNCKKFKAEMYLLDPVSPTQHISICLHHSPTYNLSKQHELPTQVSQNMCTTQQNVHIGLSASIMLEFKISSRFLSLR